MPTRKAQVKTTTKKVKGSQKPQARRSGGQPKKGTHCQKRQASDGSDDVESSEAEPGGPRFRPQKRSRHVDIDGEKNDEEVEIEENEEDVEQVADGDDDDAQSEDVEQVSLL